MYHFRQRIAESFVNIRVIFVDIRYTFEVPAGDLLWPSNKLKEEMKLPTVHEGVE